jgi:DNA (cytosine-5)-methyltransferase 1
MKPTFGSLFAGVGGFDMGMEQAGWECLFQVEWDKNCQNILNRHWPDVPKWGDVSTVSGTEIPPVDCIIFGSPCQDLSVAGKRAGLEGERSGLFHEAVRIIKEMRDGTDGVFPRWAIWENVAGALSSNAGRDFGTVINEMAEAGAVLQEFAVLDAQHFGVPQRRRRVFLVACFDPSTAFKCPDPLLPVSESVRRDSAKGKPKGQAASRTLTEGIGSDGAWWDGGHVAEALTTTSNEQRMPDKNRLQVVVEGFTSSSFAQYTEGVGTLRSNGGDLGGGSETVVVEPFVKSRRAQTIGFSHTQGLSAQPSETAFPTLPTEGNGMAVAYDEYNDRLGGEVHHALRAGTKQSTGVLVDNEVVGTLRSGGDGGVPSSRGEHLVLELNSETSVVAPTLLAGMSHLTGTTQDGYVKAINEASKSMIVRRLTPLECERLMGWPDDHTRWKADGTEQADTHRYKQCGNGVATPVAKWIAQHILKANQ